jgi:hypothetical protein
MTYDCPAWKSAADIQILKLQRLQDKILRAIGNFPWRMPIMDLYMAFKLTILL